MEQLPESFESPYLQESSTFKECRDHFIAILSGLGLRQSEAIAEFNLVMQSITKLSSSELLLGKFKQIGPAAPAINAILDERLRRRPLQYILGEAWFLGRRFAVGEGVLVPRPETEILTEQSLIVLNQALAFGGRQPHFVEVGGGSGCISISLLLLSPGSTAHVFEASPQAGQYLSKNAQTHGVSDRLLQYNYDFFSGQGQASFAEICQKAKNGEINLALFVSNPPYVSPEEMETLEPEVANYEPDMALRGSDADGLGFYRGFAGAVSALAPSDMACLVEVGQGQASAVSDIFARAGFSGIYLWPDLAGIERVVASRLDKKTL